MIFEKQEYQQECIENIITLLEHFDFKAHSTQNLKECLQDFYAKTNALNAVSTTPPPQSSLKSIIPIHTLSERLNVDILMETGTGKTFTYLNLIFELHKHYKQNKFIIFVPRKAILESVKQNVALTKDYFYNQYKEHLHIYTHDSKSQSAIINHYIKNTNELSVLILTSSAIDKNKSDESKGKAKKKTTNILHRCSENLFNKKSIFENIASLKPICIIDEPHLLKGEKFNESFSKINTLHFRFGATFPSDLKGDLIKASTSYALSNVIYCLDSINAFRKYLVKQIRVHTISQDSQTPFLLSTTAKKAKLAFFTADYEHSFEFGKDDDLGKLDSSLIRWLIKHRFTKLSKRKCPIQR